MAKGYRGDSLAVHQGLSRQGIPIRMGQRYCCSVLEVFEGSLHPIFSKVGIEPAPKNLNV